MRTHIGPRRIYCSDWEFVHSYMPRRTAFGCLVTAVVLGSAIAVAGLLAWLVVNDRDLLRLVIVMTGMLALSLMGMGWGRWTR